MAVSAVQGTKLAGIPFSRLTWKGCVELSLLVCMGCTGRSPLSLPILALSLLEL